LETGEEEEDKSQTTSCIQFAFNSTLQTDLINRFRPTPVHSNASITLLQVRAQTPILGSRLDLLGKQAMMGFMTQ
jgi:hypothetical protein